MTTSNNMHDANPQMGDEFARIYEAAANRITGPVSRAVLDLAGGIGAGTRLLDIAAGAGALSVPAAKRGAAVVAVDIAPGLVRRLQARLSGFPSCGAAVENGEDLNFPDGAFDATFSVFGVMNFADWRKGLAEQARGTGIGGQGMRGNLA